MGHLPDRSEQRETEDDRIGIMKLDECPKTCT